MVFIRGIGSKLMRMMGYKMGEGLGKGGLGRVEPVPVEKLPQGVCVCVCVCVYVCMYVCVCETRKKC